MKYFKNIVFGILLVIFILELTGCSKENLTMESKIESEIEFCENQILLFLKKLEGDEYVKDDNLDWDKISEDNKLFLDSIPVIESDLDFVNLEKNKIEDIKTSVQYIQEFLNSRDVEKLMIEYANLYNKICSVKITDNKELKIIVMNCYIKSFNNSDIEINNEINNLSQKYKNLKSNSEFVKINGFSLRKINDNIDDLKKCLDEKDYKRLRKHCLKIVEII